MPRFLPEHIAITCEFMLGGDVVRPGFLLRIKNVYGPVLYQCLVHDTENDVTYIWCQHKGKWRTFPIGSIKSIVVSKRSYKKQCRS